MTHVDAGQIGVEIGQDAVVLTEVQV